MFFMIVDGPDCLLGISLLKISFPPCFGSPEVKVRSLEISLPVCRKFPSAMFTTAGSGTRLYLQFKILL